MKTRYFIILGLVMSSLFGYVQHVDADSCVYVNRHSPCIDSKYLQPTTFDPNFTLSELNWKQASYPIKNGTGFVDVVLEDHDSNKNPNYKETVNVFVHTDSEMELHVIELQETENNSGLFERKFGISSFRSAPNVVFTQFGDTITVMYIDTTLPSEFFVSDGNLSATALIGSTGPPLERAPASSPRLSDLDYNLISYPVIGEQILLTSDIENNQNRNQNFVWIAQILDEEKKTQALSWINGTLNAESSFSPTTSWIPNVAGDYKVVFFVWESITNPTALSPPIELDFTVLYENPARHNYDELTNNELLERQNLIKQLRTIPRENTMDHLSDTAYDFVISEVLKNNQVSSILEGYTYDVECCSFSPDRQNPIFNQHVGMKFHVEEKYLFVTVTFDLKQEKITAILKGSGDGFSIVPIDD